MNGINYVTNEKNEIKAILIDLVQLKQNKSLAQDVLNCLQDLDSLIKNAPLPSKQNTWDVAKQALNNTNKHKD